MSPFNVTSGGQPVRYQDDKGTVTLGALVPFGAPSVAPGIFGLGDSLSDGTYEPTLQGLLGAAWQVLNAGVGGNRIADMLARIGQVEVPNAKVVVVLAGINDIRYDDAPVASVESGLQSLYSQIQGNRAKVIAVTLTPFKGNVLWAADKQVTHDTVNAWILGAAVGPVARVDAYSALVDPSTPQTLLPAYDSGDHLHLSAAGYVALATAIYTQAAPWVLP